MTSHLSLLFLAIEMSNAAGEAKRARKQPLVVTLFLSQTTASAASEGPHSLTGPHRHREYPPFLTSNNLFLTPSHPIPPQCHPCRPRGGGNETAHVCCLSACMSRYRPSSRPSRLSQARKLARLAVVVVRCGVQARLHAGLLC